VRVRTHVTDPGPAVADFAALPSDRYQGADLNAKSILAVHHGCAIATSSAWSQDRAAREALVIGNANYPDASTPLSTTIADVRGLAQELRRSGFQVDLKEDLGKADMQRTIDAFVGKIGGGTTALFYFSGYGIQVARQTYLIPVNAQMWTEDEVRRDGISADALLAEMNRRGAKVKIIILDAARRNPFERRFRQTAAGLAGIDAPENTLAMFSAAPGRLINDRAGANGLFAGELIKELRLPNVSAEEVFNRVRLGVSRATNNEQVPWVASSLAEPFYFGSAAAQTPSAAVTPSVPARASGSVKEIFEKYNLLGTLAFDCSKPVSRENRYYFHRLIDADRVQRDMMSGPATRDFTVIIERATELRPSEIALGGKRDGEPVESVYRVEPTRARVMESTAAGRKEISGGRFVNGGDTPWMNKCSTAADQAAAADPRPTGAACTRIEGRILADMCNGCTKPPFTWTLDKSSGDEWVSKFVDGNDRPGSNRFRTTSQSSSEIVMYDASRDYYVRFDLPAKRSFQRRGTGNWILHSELLDTNC
jgi:Caspase domain